MNYRRNFYENSTLDRAAHLREDEDWYRQTIVSIETRILPVWRSQSFVSGVEGPDLAHLTGEDLGQLDHEAAFLGLVDDTPYFAMDFSRHEDPGLSAHGEFHDLRAVGPQMTANQGALAAYARGILHWHRRHQFCGRCGWPTVSVWAGHKRNCSNPDCNLDHFPRTDPAVIMLIHDDQNRVLMARHPNWAEGLHSVLAGFVEPCESLEQAVAREVYEEAGIRITDIRYHSSQPWPFPSNIMLGFTARALKTDLTLDPNELAEACWMTPEELRNSPENETFSLPRPDSISRVLIEDWIHRH
ncbi:NAD(+) diphosphatase [Aestuariispira insulae]|uniref:NAD(+) diphosphatase n=1 Tax=Aestuariispira insulae TaxID=1461337 RepID=A0A3D9H6N8_9PROT|nr:NAD(+) diphosphatase [Aestuariispira insulae]RED45119.1 NAD+ diphosphatase [Aestuariispira insulae]